MASKISVSLVIFLTLTTAYGGGCSSIPKPKPKPKSTSSPSSSGNCRIETLKLGVLKDLPKIELDTQPVKPCCSLLKGLVDLEAAACLCTAIKANVLGLKLNVPVSLNLLPNACDRKIPSGFKCA